MPRLSSQIAISLLSRHMGPIAVSWLTALFSEILQTGNLPKEFKLAKVIAILKPGKSDDQPENYRPIALLSCVYKLLERLILIRIEPYLDAVTPPEQAGFRRGRNCVDQVLALTNHIEGGFQNKMKSTAVFIDLTAAYDTVWTQGLMYKLMSVVPSREVCDLVSNMLNQRQFEVFLGQDKSRKRKLDNGLPQGSVLAPQLFNLYIHDLPSTTAAKFIYADDIALVTQSRDFSTGETILTSDLKVLSKYFE
uniref:Reverse transcriptase domain-containing protein n=1 Tax=Heliothis virescens TaxID=7102 RepID=A0A2A4JQG8_HELVI